MVALALVVTGVGAATGPAAADHLVTTAYVSGDILRLFAGEGVANRVTLSPTSSGHTYVEDAGNELRLDPARAGGCHQSGFSGISCPPAVARVIAYLGDANDYFGNYSNLFVDIHGDAGDDDLWGWFPNESFHGGDGDDALYGLSGADTLSGDAGEDVLEGFNGNDTIYGGADDDIIRGKDGNDTLSGDGGVNEVCGGSRPGQAVLPREGPGARRGRRRHAVPLGAQQHVGLLRRTRHGHHPLRHRWCGDRLQHQPERRGRRRPDHLPAVPPAQRPL